MLRALATLLPLLLAACAAPDPARFDATLRQATFDGYVRAIADQLGRDREDCTEAALQQTFGARLAAATTPAAYLRLLRDLALHLGDPHARFDAPDQPWLRVGIGRHYYLTDATVEHGQLVRADGAWWLQCAATGVDPGGDLAARIAASAGDASQPAPWRRVEAIDGVAVPSAAAADLLLPGELLGAATIASRDANGAPVDLRVPRNRASRCGAVRVGVPPRRFAAADLGGAPIDLGEIARVQARMLWSDVPLFRGGDVLRRPDGTTMARNLFVWRSGAVGYLRVGSFREDPGADHDATEPAVRAALAELAGCDALIVDLMGNRGGMWSAMACLTSAFLPEGTRRVPHVGVLTEVAHVLGVLRHELRQTMYMDRLPMPVMRPPRLVVLVDQHTASASEITASMLRGLAGAQLVGERTVGAETWVHEVAGVDGSRLEFGLPGGMTDGCERFQGRGLQPDVVIERRAATLQARGAEAARQEQWAAIRREALRMVGLDPDLLVTP